MNAFSASSFVRAERTALIAFFSARRRVRLSCRRRSFFLACLRTETLLFAKQPPFVLNKTNAGTQNRTVDTRIFSPVLYQLSYPGTHSNFKHQKPLVNSGAGGSRNQDRTAEAGS